MPAETLIELADLPEQERKRLASLSLPELLQEIENLNLECEGGHLRNFTVWMDLKARVAHLQGAKDER